MSAAGKGSYDTEFSITFSFWDILVFLIFIIFLITERLSDFYKKHLLGVGVKENSVF